MSGSGFTIGWDSGAMAQVELSSPKDANGKYRIKFTPPYRKTIRPPDSELRLTRRALSPIDDRLAKLAVESESARKLQGNVGGVQVDIAATAKSFGRMLSSLVVPPPVLSELSGRDLYLEFGVDEQLLGYPWELLHDDDDFLCLKHKFGRFVNASSYVPPPANRPTPWERQPLSVLLVSVPNPQPREPGVHINPLTWVEQEAETTRELLSGVPDVELRILSGSDATHENVWQALDERRYHIIHFSGHAEFDEQQMQDSGLVLFDQNMSAAHLTGLLARHPPVLAFMNACETAKTGNTAGAGGVNGWSERTDLFGLARPFLEVGSYLIGSRWLIDDKAAAAFARAFYEKLVEGMPLGDVIRMARLASRDASKDLSWGSYVYYGDPRICFRRT